LTAFVNGTTAPHRSNSTPRATGRPWKAAGAGESGSPDRRSHRLRRPPRSAGRRLDALARIGHNGAGDKLLAPSRLRDPLRACRRPRPGLQRGQTSSLRRHWGRGQAEAGQPRLTEGLYPMSPLENRETHAATLRGPRPDPRTAPSARDGTIVTHSVVKSRAPVVDLAAWRRLRNHPGAGDWWGSAGEMWSWSRAADSCRGWSA